LTSQKTDFSLKAGAALRRTVPFRLHAAPCNLEIKKKYIKMSSSIVMIILFVLIIFVIFTIFKVLNKESFNFRSSKVQLPNLGWKSGMSYDQYLKSLRRENFYAKDYGSPPSYYKPQYSTPITDDDIAVGVL
jgi:hypothetical protein